MPGQFTEWLGKQRHREDEIGDLAGEVADDRKWPDPKNLDQALAYLRGQNKTRLSRLMRTAFAEFEKFKKTPPPVEEAPPAPYRPGRQR